MESISKQLRIRRLWKHDRTVIIPFDHGSYSGPVEGIGDPRSLVERIASTEADAILVTPGLIKQIAPSVGQLGIVVRMDGGFTTYSPGPVDYQAMFTAEDAVRTGADAGIVFTFVGTGFEAESLRRLGATAAESDRWNFPLISEVLPPSLLNNHFGTTMFPKGSGDQVAETRTVARIAAEAGADVIKTRFVGTVDQFRGVVDQCGAPIIIAGGPNLNGTDEQLLRLTRDCVDAGAAGIIFGRNVWQHPAMERLIGALCAIVHHGESVAGALKLLR